MKRTIYLMVMVVLSSSSIVLGQSNINPDHKFSWNENIGWMNWRDADATNLGVFVNSGFLFGSIWAENVGWINVGQGPLDGVSYANIDGTDFGVNIDDMTGDLYGYAWGENVGWLNFDTSSLGLDLARYDATANRFRGYVWGENIGWVNLNDETHFVGTCLLAASPLAGFERGINRFLSVSSGDNLVTALRVTFDDFAPSPVLDEKFQSLIGKFMWVGQPQEICENSGQNASTPIEECGPTLGSDPEVPGPTLFVAQLQCDPFFMDWSTIDDVINITSEFVVPNSIYSIQSVAQSCSLADEANFSNPLVITNPIWGDIVGLNCLTSETCSPPDGSVGITSDVSAVLEMFKNTNFAPGKARSDVEPSLPDLIINFTDVVQVLGAFSSVPYPFAPTTTNPCQ